MKAANSRIRNPQIRNPIIYIVATNPAKKENCGQAFGGKKKFCGSKWFIFLLDNNT